MISLRNSILFALPVLILLGCDKESGKQSNFICIYYENGNVDDSGFLYPDLKKIEDEYPTNIRDLGIKTIDSAFFYSLCRQLDTTKYAMPASQSMRFSGDYKMYIKVENYFSDSLVLNSDNIFYSFGKKGGSQLDSLAYLLRDSIDYYEIFDLEDLKGFRKINMFHKDIGQKSIRSANQQDPPTLYTKIILIPSR
ncbi:hypothetical protein HP439_12375 [Sphingobacterium shayense]|uniref:hypothetical protein n=1 Tax=Sphingobacterium shayense TaxID=626343 RepID=UPI001551ED33|nr:hypothetical protein [Sphingobacterium shayense]NQD71520.1 hypothetical protein [Sphingobacterium shayense]